MTNVVVFGMTFGDEGKGKIVDFLADNADWVVRYNGGGNAGHTLKIDGKKIVLHYMPSGIIRKKKCIIGHGCVVSLDAIRKEMEDVRNFGIEPLDYLRIANNAHLVLPNIKEDGVSASTSRGIAPTYKNKYARTGLRAIDLVHAQNFDNDEKRELFNQYHSYLKKHSDLIPILTHCHKEINDAIDNGKNILFEGAQGFGLGIDDGQYPFVTSSSPGVSGVLTGAGIGPKKIDKVIGVFKPYVTRAVDKAAPIIAEMDEKLSSEIREIAGEYGATTGIARRIGWLDIPQLKLAAKLNNVDGMVLTKLDILDYLDEIKICVAYDLGGEKIDINPCDGYIEHKCKPILEVLPGWKGEIVVNAKTFEELPENAKRFVNKIEDLVGVKIVMISNGAERDKTIIKEKVW